MNCEKVAIDASIENMDFEKVGMDASPENMSCEKVGMDAPPGNMNCENVVVDTENRNCEKVRMDAPSGNMNCEKVGVDAPPGNMNCEKVGGNAPPENMNCEKVRMDAPPENMSCEKVELGAQPGNMNCEKVGVGAPPGNISCEKVGMDTPPGNMNCEKVRVGSLPENMNCKQVGIDASIGNMDSENEGVYASPENRNCEKVGVDAAPKNINCEKVGINASPVNTNCEKVRISESSKNKTQPVNQTSFLPSNETTDRDLQNANPPLWLMSFGDKHTFISLNTETNEPSAGDLFKYSSTLRNSTEIVLKLNHLRQIKELCDFEIHTSDNKIRHAHFVILACCSPVFYEFINIRKAATPGGTIKYHSKASSEVWDSLLNFMYTGRLEIAKEHIEAFAEAAKALRITIPNSSDSTPRKCDTKPKAFESGNGEKNEPPNMDLYAEDVCSGNVDPVVIKTEPNTSLEYEDDVDTSTTSGGWLGQPLEKKHKIRKELPARARKSGRFVSAKEKRRRDKIAEETTRRWEKRKEPGNGIVEVDVKTEPTSSLSVTEDVSENPRERQMVTRRRSRTVSKKIKVEPSSYFTGDDDDPENSSNGELDDPSEQQQTAKTNELDDPDYEPDFCAATGSSADVTMSTNSNKWILEEFPENSLNREDRTNSLQTAVEHEFIHSKTASSKHKVLQPKSSEIREEQGKGFTSEFPIQHSAHDEKQSIFEENTRTLDSNSDTDDGDNEPRLCILCGEDFVNERQFVDHSREKHSDVPNKCLVCFRFCPSLRYYTKHTKLCMNDRQCHVCDKTFLNNVSLLKHMKLRHTVLPFKCLKCGLRFESKDQGSAHFEKAHNATKAKHAHFEIKDKPRVQCPLCSLSNYISKLSLYMLEKHVWVVHKNRKYFKCGVCGKEFGNKTSFCAHKVTHETERPHKCEICNNTYKSVAHLNVHKRVHSDTKNHVCDFCGKQFYQHKHLAQHRRIHTGEKPYICHQCGVGFAQTASLKYHLEHIHGLHKNT